MNTLKFSFILPIILFSTEFAPRKKLKFTKFKSTNDNLTNKGNADKSIN